MGGGGAVGLAAIYIAKAAGCYVSCTCGKRSMEKVKEAGAEEAVDYASPVSHNIFFVEEIAIYAILDMGV